MIILDHTIHGGSTEPELMIGFLAILGLAAGAIWAIVRRLQRAQVSPDPWNESVAAEVEKENAKPLCHRCLMPHDSWVDFCPDCGASVGQYTNWLPYPYLFSLGHMLRVGTSGEFKKTVFNVIGFVLLGFAEYVFFAPIYWLVLFLKFSREPESGSQAEQISKTESQV